MARVSDPTRIVRGTARSARRALQRPRRRRNGLPLGVVDYTLAKRALLREFHSGLLSRLEICDAHPELMRAARYLGSKATRPCPVCHREELRLLAYVYGDGMDRENGRAFDLQEGLTIAAGHRGTCYV